MLDLQKAFDTVDHSIPCKKLEGMGFISIEWFKSYLSGRQQVVTIDGITSCPGLSSCTTTELSKLFTSCLTAVKNHVIRYYEKVYERSGKNLFWSIKNSGEVLNKLKSRGFRATSLSTYDFSTLYTTLPHNLIKEKLINLIEWTFKREGSP